MLRGNDLTTGPVQEPILKLAHEGLCRQQKEGAQEEPIEDQLTTSNGGEKQVQETLHVVGPQATNARAGSHDSR